MTYYKRHKDKTQDPCVAELRRDGATVQSATGLGDGFPDLIIGLAGLTITGDPEQLRLLRDALLKDAHPSLRIHDGANLLVELKSGRRGDLKTKKATREKQQKFRDTWKGQHAKCLSVDEVFALAGLRRQPPPLSETQPECPTPRSPPGSPVGIAKRRPRAARRSRS